MSLPYSTLDLLLISRTPECEPALWVSWANDLLSAGFVDDLIIDLAICDHTEWERVRLVAPKALAAVGINLAREEDLRATLVIQITGWLGGGQVSGATIIDDYRGRGWSHEDDPWREQIAGFFSDLGFWAEGVAEGWAETPEGYDPPSLNQWVLNKWAAFVATRKW